MVLLMVKVAIAMGQDYQALVWDSRVRLHIDTVSSLKTMYKFKVLKPLSHLPSPRLYTLHEVRITGSDT